MLIVSKETIEKVVELKQVEMKDNRVGNRRRILAVDDDPINLKVLKSILPQDEYELETVTTGRGFGAVKYGVGYDISRCDDAENVRL